jgi:hypothetical protein
VTAVVPDARVSSLECPASKAVLIAQLLLKRSPIHCRCPHCLPGRGVRIGGALHGTAIAGGRQVVAVADETPKISQSRVRSLFARLSASAVVRACGSLVHPAVRTRPHAKL